MTLLAAYRRATVRTNLQRATGLASLWSLPRRTGVWRSIGGTLIIGSSGQSTTNRRFCSSWSALHGIGGQSPIGPAPCVWVDRRCSLRPSPAGRTAQLQLLYPSVRMFSSCHVCSLSRDSATESRSARGCTATAACCPCRDCRNASHRATSRTGARDG